MKTAHILILWLLTWPCYRPGVVRDDYPPFEIKRANGACTVEPMATITCTAAAAADIALNVSGGGHGFD